MESVRTVMKELEEAGEAVAASESRYDSTFTQPPTPTAFASVPRRTGGIAGDTHSTSMIGANDNNGFNRAADRNQASKDLQGARMSYDALRGRLFNGSGKRRAVECVKCFDQADIHDAVSLTKCRHVLCLACLYSAKAFLCPFCRTEYLSSEISEVSRADCIYRDLKTPSPVPYSDNEDYDSDDGEDGDDNDDSDGCDDNDDSGDDRKRGSISKTGNAGRGKEKVSGKLGQQSESANGTATAAAVVTEEKQENNDAKETDEVVILDGPPQKVARLSDVNEEDQHLGQSPKIKALIQAIKGLSSNVKCVVLSQWDSLLNIVQAEFDSRGYTHCRIDGNQSTEQNLVAMERFNGVGLNKEDSPQFVLCTMHACARHINLYRASVVFLMDSMWDATAEDLVSENCAELVSSVSLNSCYISRMLTDFPTQIVASFRRLGPAREVRLVKFIMKDTIEECLCDMQKSKAKQESDLRRAMTHAEKRKLSLHGIHKLFKMAPPADPVRPTLRNMW
jgi:zinc-RING finger domain